MAVFMVLLRMFRLTSFGKKKVLREMADPVLLITDKFNSSFDDNILLLQFIYIICVYTNHNSNISFARVHRKLYTIYFIL